MFGVGLVELGAVGVLFSVLCALVLWRVSRALVLAFSGSGATAVPTREWQLVLGVRLLGMVVGALLAVFTFSLGSNGRGPMLSLAVFGLSVLLATAIGETVVRPHPTPGVRTASLTPRRIRDYLPWTTPLVGFLVVAAVAVLTVTTLTASDDELGRARVVACRSAAGAAARSPYPGAFYSLPLAVALLVVLGSAALAARRVVDRPRGMAASPDDDDGLRRNSLDMVLAATGTAVAAPLFGVALVGGGGMRILHEDPVGCAPGWYGPAGIVLLLIALVALWSTSLFLGRLVLVKSTGRA
ncbi:MAG TPA: hypothetical protein VFI19_11845 [Nocardioides sp.]|nr:hypothetical protein [Nocardioides sp.]